MKVNKLILPLLGLTVINNNVSKVEADCWCSDKNAGDHCLSNCRTDSKLIPILTLNCCSISDGAKCDAATGHCSCYATANILLAVANDRTQAQIEVPPKK